MTAQSNDAKGKGQLDKLFEPPASHATLYQRIATVQGELGDISATGKNQFAAKALSIGDVEGALRAPLAKAGVVTRWSYVELAQIEKGLWRAHLKVTVCNADVESDLFEDEWIDVGGNPMAATSFARKGYLKALFHLTEENDEKGVTQTQSAPQREPEPARTVAPPARTPTNGGGSRTLPPLCEQCAKEGLKNRKGYAPRLWPGRNGKPAQCDGIEVDGSFANHGVGGGAAVADAFFDGEPPLTDADR